ncbi:hypothetical protein A3195_16925 [Candidatus Thiodiazotropha endoloripes]|uniref:hypothetical protein n=1 Tax=Candidatus Thiodiazotropha endoloripes TaxID=1818881 RepID=UPI00083CB38F|nr:hypothetical protein [Candidatus Thiodiazotropha endoloripes]ODB85282.1 hypothetical protein A3195_16925 [Candidatus Thiodiazotropha endoloripes]
MTDHIIDTNVLIVASGEHPDSPFLSTEHPVENPELAGRVLDWVSTFINSDSQLIVDLTGAIYKEYRKKLSDQNYGLRAYIDKYDKGQIQLVDLAWEVMEPDWTAELSAELKILVHDRSDRKMVAACISASDDECEATIVNACETDWIDWEDGLRQEGVIIEQLIDEWVRAKWAEKQRN